MNPKALVEIVILVIAVIAMLTVLIVWMIRRNAGVRRAEYEAMRTERNNAWTALADVEESIDATSDIDSPMAAKIRPIIREHNAERMEVRR